MSGRRADIHFHLLPGVDDGAANLEETVELARRAEADGTGVIVATPHVRSDFLTDVSDLPDRVAEVRARLALEDIDVDVRCGGELGHEMVGGLGRPSGVAWPRAWRGPGEGVVGAGPGAGADPHGLGAAGAAGAGRRSLPRPLELQQIESGPRRTRLTCGHFVPHSET